MPRYAYICFPFLLTEFTTRKKPELREQPFVLASRQRGRMVIDSVNANAMSNGIRPGMTLADCKAIFPELQMFKSETNQAEKLLNALAEWCIQFTPFVAIDLPDGLILDTSGCTHLWSGEMPYLNNIKTKLNAYGYTVQAAIADTIGTASAVAKYDNRTLTSVVESGKQRDALRPLPPAALRLESEVLERLKKLGLQRIGDFADMPMESLRRRFGSSLPFRLRQALGFEIEMVAPVKPIVPYQERLCSLDPISTSVGIAIALEQLLETLCTRLQTENMGLRNALFKTYRVDGNIQQIKIGTSRPSNDKEHLFKLFEHKIATLQPDLGFEVFVLEASKVESVANQQASIWMASNQNNKTTGELLDRIAAKINTATIERYLPAEHYWPERSVKKAMPLWEKPTSNWRIDWPRPVHLMECPEPIAVTAALPDYPPMLFRYREKLYNIEKSDGPERIEQEWWLANGCYRDYYCVEDENGARYWVFRSGNYERGQAQWFIHGFFA